MLIGVHFLPICSSFLAQESWVDGTICCVLLRWTGLTLSDQKLVHVAPKQIGIHVLGCRLCFLQKTWNARGTKGRRQEKSRQECKGQLAHKQ